MTTSLHPCRPRTVDSSVCCTYAGNGRFIRNFEFLEFLIVRTHARTLLPTLHYYISISLLVLHRSYFFCLRYLCFINILVRIHVQASFHSPFHLILYAAYLLRVLSGLVLQFSDTTSVINYNFSKLFECVKRKNYHNQDTKFLFYFCV